MKTITGDEFYELLKSPDITHIDQLKINITEKLIIDVNEITHKNTIRNCIFNDLVSIIDREHYGERGLKHTLIFDTCDFHDLDIYNAFFLKLHLRYIRILGKQFHIGKNIIKEFDINQLDLFSEANTIFSNEFIDRFDLNRIETKTNSFEFKDNFFSKGTLLEPCSIRYCQFFNFQFSNNKFERSLYVTGNKFTTDIKEYSRNYFTNCQFEKIFLTNNNFGEITTFEYCTFNDISNWENSGILFETELMLFNCSFKNSVSFNKSTLNKLIINTSIFENLVSLQDTTFNNIFIDKTIFEKIVLFDNIQIKKIQHCDRKTIRNIKQQLQKAENRIDHNRFKSYELQAYYKELNWNSDFKDKFILAATWLATGFEHSWRRALLFTLSFGFLFYSLFFISENYMLSFDWRATNSFFSGYFRFLIVTDFYNPLEQKRIFINNSNTIGWIIFILGKIFIAFGIYEMIQAFRKFKA